MSGAGAMLENLRREFDAAFASPPVAPAALAAEGFLAIRVAGDGYLLRASEVRWLTKGRRIVRVPSDCPHLLGIAGVRGTLVPTYSLASLLGYGRVDGSAAWLVLVGAGEPTGLAVDDYEGLLRCLPEELHTAPDGARAHVRGVVQSGAATRPIVSIPSALGAIALAAASPTRSER